jgi:hypothetical protein
MKGHSVAFIKISGGPRAWSVFFAENVWLFGRRKEAKKRPCPGAILVWRFLLPDTPFSPRPMTTRKERNLARALNQQRESRIARLLEAGMIKSAADIPEDALPAALELQNPNGTWSPPLFYRDLSFHCKDCGKHEGWSAMQQRWYYEIAKGPLHARATRCRACRKKHRDETLRQRELLRLHREKKAAGTVREAAEMGKK